MTRRWAALRAAMWADWALDAAIVALAASMAKDASDLRSSGVIDAENAGTWLPWVAMLTLEDAFPDKVLRMRS